MYLKISEAIALAINTINQQQPDQLIAITFKGVLLVQDVRHDPAWAPWHEVLATAEVYQPPIKTLEFFRLLTQQERIAIRTSTNPLIIDWRDLLSVTPTVDLTDPELIQAIHYLEDQGLLAPGRANTILAYVGELNFSSPFA